MDTSMMMEENKAAVEEAMMASGQSDKECFYTSVFS